jgi:hypothetical protein
MSDVRKTSTPARRARLIALLATVPIATAAISAALAIDHLRGLFPKTGEAAAAVILGLLALLDAALVWSIGKHHDPWQSASKLPWREFAKCLLVAAAVVLALALVAGQDSGGEFVLITGVAAAAIMILLPIAAPVAALDFWRRLARRRWIRKSSLVAYSTVVALTTAELILQAAVYFPNNRDEQADRSTAQASLMSPEQLLPAAAPSAAATNWSNDQSDGLRLAMVGDRNAIDALGHNFNAQQASSELRLAIRHFPSSDSQNVKATRQTAQRITSARPQLVLAVISIDDDFSQAPSGGWLDWRGLQVPRFAARLTGLNIDEPVIEARQPSAFQKLSVCRKGASPETRAQWRRMTNQVTALAAQCREKRVPMALVVLPAKFQLNRPAREALLHQAGYASDSLDLDLPQRRLAALAHQEQLPILDLMPELRLSDRSLYIRGTESLNADGQLVAQQAMCDWIERSVNSQRLLLADLRSTR